MQILSITDETIIVLHDCGIKNQFPLTALSSKKICRYCRQEIILTQQMVEAAKLGNQSNPEPVPQTPPPYVRPKYVVYELQYESFIRRYQYDAVKDRLSSGGAADVFKAYDRVRDRYVVLKLTKRSDFPNLEDEWNIAWHIGEHPDIAYYESYYRLKSVSGDVYEVIILAYYERGSLKDLIQSTYLTHRQLLGLVGGILNGIRGLHKKQVIHGDLKPQNILIAQRGDLFIPKLTDFGSSINLSTPVTREHTASQRSPSFSVGYASPEQLAGNSKLGVNSDLWSFGVLLYEMLTGYPINRAATRWDSPDNLYAFVPDLEGIREPYRLLLERCLVVSAAKRETNVENLLDLLPPLTSTQSVNSRVTKPTITKGAMLTKDAVEAIEEKASVRLVRFKQSNTRLYGLMDWNNTVLATYNTFDSELRLHASESGRLNTAVSGPCTMPFAQVYDEYGSLIGRYNWTNKLSSVIELTIPDGITHPIAMKRLLIQGAGYDDFYPLYRSSFFEPVRDGEEDYKCYYKLVDQDNKSGFLLLASSEQSNSWWSVEMGEERTESFRTKPRHFDYSWGNTQIQCNQCHIVMRFNSSDCVRKQDGKQGCWWTKIPAFVDYLKSIQQYPKLTDNYSPEIAQQLFTWLSEKHPHRRVNQ